MSFPGEVYSPRGRNTRPVNEEGHTVYGDTAHVWRTPGLYIGEVPSYPPGIPGRGMETSFHPAPPRKNVSRAPQRGRETLHPEGVPATKNGG